MSVMLLDGDITLFEACMAAETEVQWSEHLWTLHSAFDKVIDSVETKVSMLARKVEAEQVVFALSCPKESRFRPQVMPTYKSNRAETRKPVAYAAARGWAQDRFDCREWPACEGDDVLGVLATSGRYTDPIIVSIDKDMMTIPGRLYRPHEDKFYDITEREADLFWMKQTLMGDRTDGYEGIPGVGPKGAEKILAQIEESLEAGGEEFTPANAWPFIVAAYAGKGLGERLALQNARMARILRAEDYDIDTLSYNLWTPPEEEAR